MTMKDLHVHIALSVILLTAGPLASAAESASFGTGGYASMLRTHEMMNKIDADGTRWCPRQNGTPISEDCSR